MVTSAACGGSSSDGAATTDDKTPTAAAEVSGLLKQGTLSICGINNYPPMEFEKGGEIVGFDIDAMNAVADKLNVKLDYQVMAFEGIMPALGAGRCDAGWSAMYLNDDRQKVADAIPYLATTAQVLVKAGNPLNIQTLDDLSGKRLAIDSGTSNLAIAKDLNQELKDKGLPGMKIQEYPKTPDTFQQIRVGRADAVIDADLVLGYLAKQEPEHFQYVRFQDATDGSFAIYVGKGSPLKDAISKALVQLKDEGALETMVSEYGLDPENLSVIGAGS
jgi:polar amino acid transport system substrate-binding protein